MKTYIVRVKDNASSVIKLFERNRNALDISDDIDKALSDVKSYVGSNVYIQADTFEYENVDVLLVFNKRSQSIFYDAIDKVKMILINEYDDLTNVKNQLTKDKDKNEYKLFLQYRCKRRIDVNRWKRSILAYFTNYINDLSLEDVITANIDDTVINKYKYSVFSDDDKRTYSSVLTDHLSKMIRQTLDDLLYKKISSMSDEISQYYLEYVKNKYSKSTKAYIHEISPYFYYTLPKSEKKIQELMQPANDYIRSLIEQLNNTAREKALQLTKKFAGVAHNYDEEKRNAEMLKYYNELKEMNVDASFTQEIKDKYLRGMQQHLDRLNIKY